MTRIHIRPARREDTPLILRFVRELAEYEKALAEVTATEHNLESALFGPDPRVHALICEQGEEAVGFALYFFNFSTWLGKHGLFVEDLYVSPEYRGHGIGRTLLRHLAQLALDSDCGRFEWNVLDWNETASRFYQSCGALAQVEWVGYRLSGAALQRFAREPG